MNTPETQPPDSLDATLDAAIGRSQKRVSFALPGGGIGSVSVNCDTTDDELEDIRQLMLTLSTDSNLDHSRSV